MNFLLNKLSLQPQVGQLAPEIGTHAAGPTFATKVALVIGGTKGIGYGIARALASRGCAVHLAGRDEAAGGRVLAELHELGGSSGGVSTHAFHAADLASVQGCRELLDTLSDGGVQFDVIVLTLGAWPDFARPLTVDGYNRVMWLDALARAFLLRGLLDRLLRMQGAENESQPGEGRQTVVLSVLASGQGLDPASLEARKEFFEQYVFQKVPEEQHADARQERIFVNTLKRAGLAHDTLLAVLAQQYGAAGAGVRFVGTFPGIVATEVMNATFGPGVAGRALASVVGGLSRSFLGRGLGIQSPEDCGESHARILEHAFLETKADDRKPTFWSAADCTQRELPELHAEQLREWLLGKLSDLQPSHT